MDAAGNDTRAQDFMCGERTYNGHTGIDIAIRDLKAAQNGVDVIAPADGRVVYLREDVVDKIVTPDEQMTSCGNALVLLHDSGWETRYCHLKENSITVKRREQVKAGQKIAELGLSGATSWPHLAFSVLRNGEFHDPFTGRTSREGCGLTPKSLWANEAKHKYHPFSIFNVGFSDKPIDPAKVDLGTLVKPIQLPTSSQALHFYASAFGTKDGDTVKLLVKDPRGIEMIDEFMILDTTENKAFFTASYERGKGVFEAGIYEGIVTLERGAGDSKKTNRWRRLIEFVDVESE
ncbi:MAG: M23 family metallopeptidase [Pseudomonadota bacterium]